jgi:hypothetical protein
MRNKKLKQGAREDMIYRYILTNFSKDDPSFARDVAKNTGQSLASVCFVLKEMVSSDLLARRRNGTSWEYFLPSPVDPDEFVYERMAERRLIKSVGAMHTNYQLLKKKYKVLSKKMEQQRIIVVCDCGKRMGLNITAEVIEDDTG